MTKIVLVVEDDPGVRRTLNRLLGVRGYEVQEAANGLEAIRTLSRVTPHAIVVDLLMPIMSGFELVKALRRNTFYSRIPIVVLTGAVDDGVGLDAIKGIPLLLKPRLDELPGAIERAIEEKALEGEKGLALAETDDIDAQAAARSHSVDR